ADASSSRQELGSTFRRKTRLRNRRSEPCMEFVRAAVGQKIRVEVDARKIVRFVEGCEAIHLGVVEAVRLLARGADLGIVRREKMLETRVEERLHLRFGHSSEQEANDILPVKAPIRIGGRRERVVRAKVLRGDCVSARN